MAATHPESCLRSNHVGDYPCSCGADARARAWFAFVKSEPMPEDPFIMLAIHKIWDAAWKAAWEARGEQL